MSQELLRRCGDAMMRRRLILRPVAAAAAAATLLLLPGDVSAAEEQADADDAATVQIVPEACRGGTCPSPASGPSPADGADGSASDGSDSDVSCGLWLGPSPIKQHHEHGFGLGLFTGLSISKGARVDPEILLPIHDKSDESWDAHPPLREYVWDGDNVPEVPLESGGGTMLFMAGAAAIAPCTSKNFNLAIRTYDDDFWRDAPESLSDPGEVHRSSSPAAGSFSYRHSVGLVAVRDIVPGEELTVECSDDDFDGGAYYLARYDEALATAGTTDGGDAVVCLDDRARVGKSTEVSGRGLFAKKALEKGNVVTSTPLIPIAREELDIEYDDDLEEGDVSSNDDGPTKQLLLNYCFGHPSSSLLLLPYGPLVHALNHPPINKAANVELKWHDPFHDNAELPRRQQHHHLELFDMSDEEVAITHGKGLMMDVVALRDIREGEELYLDYGREWERAWHDRVDDWNKKKGKAKADADRTGADEEGEYVAPWDLEKEQFSKPIRTVDEQEDEPYPDNIRTVCHYADFANEWNESEEREDDEKDWWGGDVRHPCLSSCAILDRYRRSERYSDVSPPAEGEEEEEVYLISILPTDEYVVSDACHLDSEYLILDAPRRAIKFADGPYESDTFLTDAFRHEIGVPDGFYPDAWLSRRKKGKSGGMRMGGEKKKDAPPSADDAEAGHEFKRKKVGSNKSRKRGIGTGAVGMKRVA